MGLFGTTVIVAEERYDSPLRREAANSACWGLDPKGHSAEMHTGRLCLTLILIRDILVGCSGAHNVIPAQKRQMQGACRKLRGNLVYASSHRLVWGT